MNFFNRLILHPKDLDFIPGNRQELENILGEIGFLDITWEYQGRNYFLIGEKFLSQIMFMGCAPSIEFEPQETGQLPANFVAIQIPEILSQAIFYPEKDDFYFRCPSCKKRSGPMKSMDIDAETTFQCLSCNKSYLYHTFNWRHQAGIGRCFIEVMGIFPQEAIPSSALLEQLKQFSGVDWGYFYASDSPLYQSLA